MSKDKKIKAHATERDFPKGTPEVAYGLGEIRGNIDYLDNERGFHKFVVGYRTENPSILVYSSAEINPETYEPNHDAIGKTEGLEKVLGGGIARLLRNPERGEDSAILNLALESQKYGGVPREVMHDSIERLGEQMMRRYNEDSAGEITEITSDVQEPHEYTPWKNYFSNTNTGEGVMNKMGNGITLKIPDELDVDIAEILRRVDSNDQNALDELVGKVYLTAIERGKFPEAMTDEVVAYCQRHQDFQRYVFEAARQGNGHLAEKLYDTGTVFWKNRDDDHAFMNLSQRYIDGTMEYMKTLRDLKGGNK